jgi:hypothetical protein
MNTIAAAGATATAEQTELETLLNELNGNEKAESLSRIYYGRFLFCLDLNQAREIRKAINGEQGSTPVQSNFGQEEAAYSEGHWFECGAECGRKQCWSCKEGMTRGEYRRTFRASQFEAEAAGPIPPKIRKEHPRYVITDKQLAYWRKYRRDQ